MADLSPADRILALLEWGDVAEADAEIDDAGRDRPGDGQVALWQGMRALMEGRFEAAERLADAATGARAGRVDAAAGQLDVPVLALLLVAACRRDEGRPVEAESLLRGLIDEYPAAPPTAHALLAVVVADLGRDGQARQELAMLLPGDPREDVAATAPGRLAFLWLLSELAVAVNAPAADLDRLYRRLSAHAGDCAVEVGGAVFYGSVSYALGRLAQARDDPAQAVEHLEAAAEAHERAGAVLLLAHTQRLLATLLRTRGEPGDWERGVALLASAVDIYRRLGIDALATETQRVLAWSEDGLDLGAAVGVAAGGGSGRASPGSPQFRRDGDGWSIGTSSTDAVRLRDAKGLHDIARLLAAPRASIHVADLLLGSASTAAAVAAGQPWSTMASRPWSVTHPVVDASTREEYESRLAELAGELVEAQWQGNAIRAALARAERDVLRAALDAERDSDPLELARRTVGARIRVSLDRIEQAHPAVGRHLRTSIRTGTFCSYEPDRSFRWAL